MNLGRQDLVGEHYNWVEANDGKMFSGTPSRRLFDRYNGEQVLFIINFYGSQSDKFSLQEGQLMEDRIAHHLPLEAKSEISVLQWLKGA